MRPHSGAKAPNKTYVDVDTIERQGVTENTQRLAKLIKLMNLHEFCVQI